ncbi:transglutaminase-like domain-containing protein, partial [Endozoicomonas sp. SESOKO2]|uniref:transglutaminase-like domain-containing protein n=2 Tax=unclassified Endozoicomonas TaxID=2644528 RepID=UPI0021474C30
YRLYLMAANLSLEELPESSTLALNNSEFDSGLCEWFNQTVPNIDRPWLIRLSDHNSIDEKRHEIRINARLHKKEAKTEIIKRVVQARWLASGLSPEPDRSDDMLTRALYRHWQQSWFNREYSRTGVDANSVFPLTEEQEQTLKLPASQPYLQEADQRISTWNSNAVQFWPAFWHQISNHPNHWVGDCSNKVLAMDGDSTPEKYKPEVLKIRAKTLDRSTNYEKLERPKFNDHEIFNTRNPSSWMYRWWAEDINVSARGDIEHIDLNDQHIQGFETLIPDRLPGPDQTLILTRDQTLATVKRSSKKGKYALPSLTPDDYIVALRMKPDLPFTLIRDHYTGLHTLLTPQAKTRQPIQFTYVVQPGEPGKKAPVKEARPEPSTWLDSHCSKGMKKVLSKVFVTIKHQRPKARAGLQKIKNAKNKEQRIRAITDYCKQFSGRIEPKDEENFFQFLVTRQQGSCRHRVPVFIAFCRYFGIPCRQIKNQRHSFAEYSRDGGQTWESADLGGAPVERTKITPDFQPIRKLPDSSTELKKSKDLLKDLLKGADLAQQRALAKACGLSLEELNKPLETKSLLPETNLSTSEILKNLWEEKDLASFSMGVSIIESLEPGALGYYESEVKPISKALRKILYDSDENQVTEQLKLLHSKMMLQGGAIIDLWLYLIVKTLRGSDLMKPSVIHFALEVMESGWLDPLPIYEGSIIDAARHHQMLVCLEAVDELKAKASQCLTKFYRQLLSREKNSQVWQLAYKGFQKSKGTTLLVTHCHDGFSPYLEKKIASSSMQPAWTFEPEGIPNIERMLVRRPAFPKFVSDKTHHRPVIIMGQVALPEEVIDTKAAALLQMRAEKRPELKKILQKVSTCKATRIRHRQALRALKIPERNIVDASTGKCKRAIVHAFCHYLHGLTNSQGGSLTFCWAAANVGCDTGEMNEYGAHDPSSPLELFAMMDDIDSCFIFQDSVNNACLRQAHNAVNALVLKNDDMDKIAEEFINSVNLNSICDALDT